MTRPRKDVEAVRDLLGQGLPIAEVARRVGIARATVRGWAANGFDDILDRRTRGADGPCAFCYYIRNLTETSYAYLLGLYLGDGYIATHKRGVYRLRIVQDNKYPNLIRACAIAMNWVIPAKIGYVPKIGCTEISSYSKHWPCVFPQHGPGRKHERRIELEPWQRWVAVEREPQMLLRGLIHSDGCRTTNRVRSRARRYEYTLYTFVNESEGIRRIFTEACGRAGVDCRQGNDKTIVISRRQSVEAMDTFIGAKS
jgi:hypothetical protein